MDTIGSGGEADRIDTDTDKAPSHMINQPNPAIVTSSARQQEPDDTTLSLPPLPDNDDSSLLLSSEDGDHDRVEDQTFLQENEMRRRLMDMESSFLPDPSTIQATTTHRTIDADDTSMVEAHRGDAPGTSGPENSQLSFMVPDESNVDITSVGDEVPIPQTPSPRSEEADDEAMDATSAASSEQHVDNATTQIEGTHSSPSAAAALRTASRNPTASSEDPRDANQTSMGVIQREHFSPPEPNQLLQSMGQNSHSEPRNLSPGPSRFFPENSGGDAEAISRASSRRSSRPKYLASRQSAHRLSYSSVTSTGTEITNSDATLGADYALQSGGAAPGMTSSIQAGQRNTLARSVSLGSMASGISGYSDDNVFDRKGPSGTTEGGLHTLNEEDGPSRSRPGSSSQHHHTHQPANHVSEQSSAQEAAEPMTPKAKHRNNSFPTDTAIAERIKDVQIPSTFVKQFREDYGSRALSPDKRTSTTAGFTKSGRTMTLKEQSSTIDRLSKENFDLKMRIHFLNEALNRRSEEGIKEMISENVELKSDKLKLQKDSQHLKRKVRELEKQLKDQQSDKESMVNHDPDGSEDEDRDAAQDEEILFLRERIETYELEIERFRSESIVRESEKRRLAEMVKSLSDGRSEGRPMGSDVGAREERDMWKDMLEAEAAAREQAEEENKRLREEAFRLRTEMMSFPLASARPGQRDWVGSVASYSAASERDFVRNANTGSSSSSTLVMELELLKQENAELRKEVSAQTSMLTSRNREKERLYQEIEELKLGQRRDGSRSVAGDSIFDRSASRAHGRPSSRASDGTGQSPGDEAEREDLEVRIGELRDQVSALKLDNQAVREQAEEYLRELEAVDKAYQADVDQADEEIETLTQERDQALQERDQALQLAEERNEAFQHLRSEAQEEIDTVGEELDQKVEECQQLNEELRVQDENLRALQAEMRSASEGIIRLEEDAQNNLQRYKAVQQELEDCNREMETLGKSLYESNTKVQRLTVQIESSQNEIAFLREEQDGDKIRIGDLESELKTYRLALQSEKDKAKELEERLAEERHQREVVGNREKQEVQRIINELNREASAAKEEVRKLRKSLSAQEIDTNTWRERLMDLENNLRETLGDLTGSRSSLISNIMKLQKELESTALELESTRSKLDEKESLLRNRDALLESHGLESRKLAELLDRERQARRADKQSFDQALKSHHQASRTITQNNSRISDLENARNQDRKRFTTIEQQFKDQLSERNAMLLTIWKRLSSMCGPDWAHSNSLINGNLPSQEVIGNILFWPGFSRNLLLAVKTLENVVLGFKARIKGVERDLAKQYQSLEHTFSLRVKKLDRLEESMMNMRAQQHNRSLSGVSPETAKLRGENRLLKAELNLLQSHSRSRGSTLAEATDGALVHGSRPHPLAVDPANSERWIQRLRELEKRLKAEREARILDRSGARKRLEERDAENQRLRAQLERRRLHHDVSTRTSSLDGDGGRPMRVPAPRQLDSSDPGTSDGYERHRDDEPSSSGEEGIYVDIEV